MSAAYQNSATPFPTEIGKLAALATPIAAESPASNYVTSIADELYARGEPVTHKNIRRILLQIVVFEDVNLLPTARLQRIWNELFTGITALG